MRNMDDGDMNNMAVKRQKKPKEVFHKLKFKRNW